MQISQSPKIERGLIKTTTGYIHYRACGRGKPIMLLHINQQSSALYLELMAVLGTEMRAVAIDYPSHGMSDHVASQPTIADYAKCVVEVMDALGIAKTSVLGEAVGAVVSIELAAAIPARVEKTILINCPYYADRAAADRSHAPLKGGLRPSDASGFPITRTIEFLLENDPAHAPMRPSQSWMDRVNVAQLEVGRDRWQAIDALHDYDVAGNLSRIRSPTLLLIGEHFHYVQFRAEFASRINDLRLSIIEGGRFCMTWERAEDIGRMTLDFVRE